ncbi:uncharacterized protein LOC121765260 [Salvia splendens]|uniref:uncharacterized protein LOC121765260 n=1 Tax=Salvia splendens TaxID=180675 RepID=UPI001C27AB0F|nr:uncharacterized protein LOC121765260 [Salvia splendens]XP_042017276.1 uncharacterized protein LOC121765260 [Salvia splendens]XP_042017277.1 uncharacterized protein LOC121765260 [Salvia splendens]
MEKKMAELMDQKLSERDQVIHEQEIQILELRQAIATIKLQNQKNNAAMDNGEGSSEGKSDWGRSTRYEFPKFDGEGFEGWMMRAEYFFQVARVPEAEKVKVAAIHMEGKALQWHRGFLTLHGNEAYVDWRYYISCVAARFGAHAFEDPLADLRNLKQKGTLQSYMDTFDELYPRASIREDQALSFFLSGLIDELQMPVRMFKPKSLAEAYSLAKLQELTVKALGIKPKVMQSNVYSNSSYYSSSKPLAVTTNSKPVVNTNNWSGGNKEPNRLGGVRASTNLSPKEMDEKRARKECFWCTEKFTPNHQCSKRKFYVIQLIELGDTAESEEQADLADETRAGEEPDLQLSLHAVWGKNGPQLMRIRGICQKKALKILIDTGSTHNFLSSRVAKKIKCELTAVSSKAVEVANGQLLQCNQKCSSLEWEMQGATFQAEVYLIHLETYDLILGGAWLSTLGEITWDFNKLTMQFKLSGAVVKLQGELWSPKSDQLHCLHICNLQEKDENERKISQLMPSIEEEISFCYEISTEEIWPELKLILDENEAIFAEPSSLPPPGEQDHKIILKEGSNAVNIRPYKYASKQKDIIETMIDEMLKSGVIRHSESSFASPIVLVKKKDSSWRMCVTCQRYKPSTTSPAGLLQPLPMPAAIFTDITMDFIEALPTSHGKDTIFVVVDRLSKYAHFMALSHPFTAKKVAEIFMDFVFKLHGMPAKIVSDRGAVFVGAFWKEFMTLLGVELLYSTAYHPETDGQSEVVNRCLQCYLRCSMGEKPHSWVQWLGLAEYWYNTTYHSSIRMTPFEALYGFPPPLHVPYLPGDSDIEAIDIALRDREEMIVILKKNIEKAAARMKKQADLHRFDREFQIGDWVWLKLQDYRQKSIRGKHHKFEAKFFGPYQIVDRMGKVAYKLNLPSSAAIHDVFHVSLLKPAAPPLGPISDLPSTSHINDAIPQAILDRKMVKRHNQAATKWLIHWKDRSPADASWEFADVITERFPWFLEDKEP